mmetsp:Transcript_2685/g.6440  ORF Transcript_2685/g.6440 Transcript_2685/m.6440 type:complete len:309 (-) Transcript_2685:309-1235(-)
MSDLTSCLSLLCISLALPVSNASSSLLSDGEEFVSSVIDLLLLCDRTRGLDLLCSLFSPMSCSLWASLDALDNCAASMAPGEVLQRVMELEVLSSTLRQPDEERRCVVESSPGSERMGGTLGRRGGGILRGLCGRSFLSPLFGLCPLLCFHLSLPPIVALVAVALPLPYTLDKLLVAILSVALSCIDSLLSSLCLLSARVSCIILLLSSSKFSILSLLSCSAICGSLLSSISLLLSSLSSLLSSLPLLLSSISLLLSIGKDMEGRGNVVVSLLTSPLPPAGLSKIFIVTLASTSSLLIILGSERRLWI